MTHDERVDPGQRVDRLPTGTRETVSGAGKVHKKSSHNYSLANLGGCELFLHRGSHSLSTHIFKVAL